jgi:hypothetical protein
MAAEMSADEEEIEMKMLIVGMVGILGLVGCVTEFEEGAEGRYMNGCDRDALELRTQSSGMPVLFVLSNGQRESQCIKMNAGDVEFMMSAGSDDCIIREGQSDGNHGQVLSSGASIEEYLSGSQTYGVYCQNNPAVTGAIFVIPGELWPGFHRQLLWLRNSPIGLPLLRHAPFTAGPVVQISSDEVNEGSGLHDSHAFVHSLIKQQASPVSPQLWRPSMGLWLKNTRDTHNSLSHIFCAHCIQSNSVTNFLSSLANPSFPFWQRTRHDAVQIPAVASAL